jgi:uncharacterized protein YdaL
MGRTSSSSLAAATYLIGVLFLVVGSVGASPGAQAATAERLRAVSIDPADYLADVPDASALARSLAAGFAANGVNAIYVNAYNVEYGAYYRTAYRYNTESDYGRQDLLGKLISAAHARGIRVFAAFYDHQHRGAWEAHQDWRAKTESGGDYNPPVTDIQYYLSVRNSGAIAWWRGFLLDLARRYPDLDGVEFREPIINWWGTTADYNADATRAFQAAHPGKPLGGEVWRRFRQDSLTRFLKLEIALVQRRGLAAHVTTVADVDGAGRLMSVASQARETGFDLDGLLAGPARPDAVKVELIWQQWARLYGRIAFTPEWTGTALRAFLRQVRGRAGVVTHVELTEFGRLRQSLEEFYRALHAADIPRTVGLDFYSAALADEKHAWPVVRSVYRRGPAAEVAAEIPHDRRILVLHDEDVRTPAAEASVARLERIEVLNLIDHLGLKWEARAVDGYRRGDLAEFDVVVYLGSRYGNAPLAFVSDVSVFDGTVVWIGQNLFQLRESGVLLPFEQPSQAARVTDGRIHYRGRSLRAKGELIPTYPEAGASAVATVAKGSARLPFVLRAGRFWYVAGSPFSFLELGSGLNGRYLVFADALHDMLRVSHAARSPKALLRVEDVNPETEPALIRDIADVFAARRAPFLLSVTPFYVAPERDLSVALSDRPDVVEALRYAVARGGAIVLHGSTHQYRGRTGIDAEFWDLKNGGGVAEDGEDYVRGRLARALAELWRNDLHPIAWETPHYVATPFDYALFADYFSTFVERRVYGVVAAHAYQQALPYPIESDVYGGRIVPENLGYVAQGQNARALVTNGAALRVVRDAFAGGYIHVATPAAEVARLVDELRRLGYRLVDPYRLSNVVEAPGRIELTGAGTASLPVPTGWFLERRVLARDGSTASRTLTQFASYARPTFTYRAVPGAGLVSLRVLSPDEAGAAGGGGGAGTPGRGVVTVLEYGLVVFATVGLGLLLVVYAGTRAGSSAGVER